MYLLQRSKLGLCVRGDNLRCNLERDFELVHLELPEQRLVEKWNKDPYYEYLS